MQRIIINLLIIASFGASCSITKTDINNIKSDLKIWSDKSTVQKAIEFEKSLSDEFEILKHNIYLSKSVFPLLDEYKIAKPFIVKRKQTGFLPIYAEYFFSERDSILRYVSYDWERNKHGSIFKRKEISKEESTKLKEYNEKYEKIKSELMKKFGRAKEQDSKPEITTSTGRGDYLSRNTIWETEEFHAELNMIFGSMTYRIRLNYYWF